MLNTNFRTAFKAEAHSQAHGRAPGTRRAVPKLRMGVHAGAANQMYQLADDVVEAVADAPAAVAEAAAPAAAATSSAAPQTLSLAAQRYAEMAGKSSKLTTKPAEAPSFSMPDFSSFEMPKFTVPELPKVEFKAPQLPKVKVPVAADAPPAVTEAALPKVELTAPRISVPEVEIPQIDLSMPKIELLAPKISVPEVSLPTVELPDVGGALSGGVNAATAEASKAAAAAGAAAGGLVSGVSSSVGAGLSSVTSATSAFTSELGREVGSLTTQIDSALGGVVTKAGSAVAQVQQGVVAAGAQAYDSLPPPLQGAAATAGDVLAVAAANPTVSLVVAGALAVPVGFKAYNDRYGGYSGDLQPGQVKYLLDNDDVVVVDVRKQELREESGTIELRKAERFKAAAIPIDTVSFSDRAKSQLTGADKLNLQVLGFMVANLNQVRSPLTKIVIMDDRDSATTRDLARAVRNAGVFQVYVMEGGFKAWEAADLGVDTKRKDYDANQIQVLADEIEEFQTVFQTQAVPKLQDPLFVVPATLAVSLVAYSLYNYHTTLRFIGLWGLTYSVYSKLSQYASLEAALEDFQLQLDNISKGVSKLSGGGKPKGSLAPAGAGGAIRAPTSPAPAAPKPAAPAAAPKPAAAPAAPAAAPKPAVPAAAPAAAPKPVAAPAPPAPAAAPAPTPAPAAAPAPAPTASAPAPSSSSSLAAAEQPKAADSA